MIKSDENCLMEGAEVRVDKDIFNSVTENENEVRAHQWARVLKVNGPHKSLPHYTLTLQMLGNDQIVEMPYHAVNAWRVYKGETETIMFVIQVRGHERSHSTFRSATKRETSTNIKTMRVIGFLDRALSELKMLALEPSIDEADLQTIKHHAEDCIGLGKRVLQILAERGTPQEDGSEKDD